MNKLLITVTQALEFIEKGIFNAELYEVVINGKITCHNAIILGEAGVKVPQAFISYPDDCQLDYSDCPELTQDDIDEGKLILVQ